MIKIKSILTIILCITYQLLTMRQRAVTAPLRLIKSLSIKICIRTICYLFHIVTNTIVNIRVRNVIYVKCLIYFVWIHFKFC